MDNPDSAATDTQSPDSGRWIASPAARWTAAAVAVLLAAAGAVYLVTSAGNDRPPAPSAGAGPASASTVDPVVSPTPNREMDEPVALLTAVQASLGRVAPGVALESSELSTFFPPEGGRHVRVYGLVRVGGRIGAINVIVLIDPEPMTCDDFESCDIGPGRCGSTVRQVEFERRVPRGQPRDLEIRVAVRWAGNALVDVSLNNATELYEAGGPPASHTGQNPPLSLAQLADFSQDPALNVLATAPAGTCG